MRASFNHVCDPFNFARSRDRKPRFLREEGLAWLLLSPNSPV
jgi:hypothetical protein